MDKSRAFHIQQNMLKKKNHKKPPTKKQMGLIHRMEREAIVPEFKGTTRLEASRWLSEHKDAPEKWPDPIHDLIPEPWEEK